MITRTFDKNCKELLKLIDVTEKGFRAALAGISQDHLNHIFAPKKMTIGQIAVHTMSWPRYFLSETPPWKETKWTCRPCSYPITNSFIKEVIDDGCMAMRDYLNNTNDRLLEIDENGEKGKGYILYRLQLHTMVHANQIAFIRQLLEEDWTYDKEFGDMATAMIATSYHTTKE